MYIASPNFSLCAFMQCDPAAADKFTMECYRHLMVSTTFAVEKKTSCESWWPPPRYTTTQVHHPGTEYFAEWCQSSGPRMPVTDGNYCAGGRLWCRHRGRWVWFGGHEAPGVSPSDSPVSPITLGVCAKCTHHGFAVSYNGPACSSPPLLLSPRPPSLSLLVMGGGGLSNWAEPSPSSLPT